MSTIYVIHYYFPHNTLIASRFVNSFGYFTDYIATSKKVDELNELERVEFNDRLDKRIYIITPIYPHNPSD